MVDAAATSKALDAWTDPAQPVWYSLQLPFDIVLPPVCPACLEPAAREVDVPQTPGPPAASFAPKRRLHAFYCEVCAEALDRQSTRALATFVAATLLGVATATTVALWLGSVRLPLQMLASSGAALAPSWWRPSRRAKHAVALYHYPSVRTKGSGAASQAALTLVCREPRYLALLGAPVRAPQMPSARQRWVHRFLPLTVALLWLLALQTFGKAQVRFVQATENSAVALVDHRRRDLVRPTLAEREETGTSVSTLAGRRQLGLISVSGDVLADVQATLWPGRQYLLAKLSGDLCVFTERQEYGAVGSKRTLTRLRGKGPLWELPLALDHWFAPPSERPDLPTTGGVRTAVRLLPCSSTPLAEGAR